MVSLVAEVDDVITSDFPVPVAPRITIKGF